VLLEGTTQRLVRSWRIVEQIKESISITIRQRGHTLLVETDFVFGNYPRFPDAIFRVAEMLDDDAGVSERLGQANPPFRTGRPGFHRDIHDSDSIAAQGCNKPNWENGQLGLSHDAQSLAREPSPASLVVLQENGLGLHRIKPHCPNENGMMERANRTLQEALEGAELTDLLMTGPSV
jgi:hypothetical protein